MSAGSSVSGATDVDVELDDDSLGALLVTASAFDFSRDGLTGEFELSVLLVRFNTLLSSKSVRLFIFNCH